jgi:hypothetical protein
MKLNPQDLKKIALLTLEHYNLRAEEFWKGTRYHNVSQNIEALLQHIKGKPPFTILDFGCGPGRDLKAFVVRSIERDQRRSRRAVSPNHGLGRRKVEGIRGCAGRCVRGSAGDLALPAVHAQIS